jgi:hypothetical protein
MSQKRCNNGHFYDPAAHASCPYCPVQRAQANVAARIPGGNTREGDGDQTWRISAAAANDETMRLVSGAPGIDPVVGWLVCVDGPERGKDYRIHSERNFIGRAATMDIRVAADDSISRERHAIITFNPRSGSFALMPSDAHGLIYHNGEEVMTPVRLAPYDILEIGKSRFYFIPFCGEKFQWHSESPPTP